MSLSILAIALHGLGLPKPMPRNPAPSNSYGQRISMRRPNTAGSVMILMYHHIAQEEKYMFRSEANFRNDLARLDEMNYRPVTIEEYVNGKMPLPPGASPVIFTFDDSHRDQFNILDDGNVDPRSFVGVWGDFAKSHPEFPVHATFYINNNGPWGQAKWVTKKAELLKQWGCEVGNHTMTHPNMKKLTDEQVMKEVAGCDDLIEKIGFKPNAFCYPFGNEPHNMKLIEDGFHYNGKFYKHTSATLAGDGPAWSTEDSKFSPYRIARIQAYPGDHGIDWWLDRVAEGKSSPYIAP